ncbi:MAG: biotin synthase BioB [Deltaproteobacteria bacterium]|nr:biotin synthase BioB [Deltaproteobacteria bacterium]
MSKALKKAEEKALSGIGLCHEDALRFSDIPEDRIFEILPYSDRIRRRFKGVEVNLCSIVNAKSGLCREDCSFCGQSIKYSTGINAYPMIEAEEIVSSALRAEKSGAREFSIVTSGTKIEKKSDVSTLKKAISGIKETGRLETCASLGIMKRETLEELKDAGLESYHHNLETSRSFFPNVCTTHGYDEDVATVRAAGELGLHVCSGGIFGLGEGWKDRVELAGTLRDLDVDSVPINFLNPRPGTPLENARNLTPLECLKIIALFRFMLPSKDIIVCGGRDVNLRDMQSLIFAAGANGMMVGDYLTTKGRPPADDLRMLEDLGLKPKA